MGNGADIPNQVDAQTRGLQSPEGCFPARARPFDIDVHVTHAMFHGFPGRVLGRQLRRKGRAFPGPLETLDPRRRPGDHVAIVGTVRAFAPSLMGMGKLRTFILQLDANSIEVLGKEPETSPPTPEEEAKMIALSKDPDVHRKILTSIAPSIFGLEHIKEAIMYLLFGGVSKSLPDVNVRGEMNALLIGDPGTAKSQLLQYVARPGDHVSIVGIVRAFAPSLMGLGKLRTFILQLDANSI